MTGFGLAPKEGTPNDAIFAWSVDDVEARYTSKGPAVPIFVEYRGIPGAKLDRDSIAWSHSYRVDFRFTRFRVLDDGALWFKPSWSAQAVCRKNGQAVAVDNHEVMPTNTTVSSGGSYPIGWHQTLKEVGPADSLTCSVRGSYTTKVGVNSMPEAVSDPVVPAQTTTDFSFERTMVGKNGSAAYAIDYTVRVTQDL